MKWMLSVMMLGMLVGCSVAIPQKSGPGAVWHLQPEKLPVAQQRKEISIVVAEPWMASGYDTSHVVVSLANGERDRLADVAWADTHGEWIRNYFIEGLQSSGAFAAVTGNQNLHDRLMFVRLYIWDFSIHYADSVVRNNPVVMAKIAVTVTNRRGARVMDQQMIESAFTVSENRLEPIMAGFSHVMQDVYAQVQSMLLAP